MASGSASGVWLMRLIYLLLCLFVIIAHLLPLDTTPRFWAPPDLLMIHRIQQNIC